MCKPHQIGCFWCPPQGISNRRYSNILFLPTPASADSPKLSFLEAFPRAFRIEAIQIQICYSCPHLKAFRKAFQLEDVWRYPYLLRLPVPESPDFQFFDGELIKARCFDAFPKPIHIDDIQITWFLPTPESPDPPISWAKLGVSMTCQPHFK